jgi:transposase-like protein
MGGAQEYAMKHYPEERKDAVLKRMMPPENTPVPVLVEETGISKVTLYHWRKQASARGLVVPGDGRNSENWSPENKFAVVLETATMSEAELSEYCRKKGLFAEQVAAWKENCLQGNASVTKQSEEDWKQARLARDEVKQLKRELYRKDKALAETAALLVLRKKMHAIWGEDEAE